MKLIVFGATGLVGKELVKQAIYNGHSVKAYGRNVFTEEFPHDEEHLEKVQGALFDDHQLAHALKGCDAVLSALGGSIDGTDKTRSLGMKHIIAQMEKTGVSRIVAVGGLGVLQFDEHKLLLEQDDYPAEFIPVGFEHRKAWDYLKASSLNWTFVCSPNIIASEASGSFHTSAEFAPEPNHFRINSGDLALFMLKELEACQYLKQRVGISN